MAHNQSSKCDCAAASRLLTLCAAAPRSRASDRRRRDCYLFLFATTTNTTAVNPPPPPQRLESRRLWRARVRRASNNIAKSVVGDIACVRACSRNGASYMCVRFCNVSLQTHSKAAGSRRRWHTHHIYRKS